MLRYICEIRSTARRAEHTFSSPLHGAQAESSAAGSVVAYCMYIQYWLGCVWLIWRWSVRGCVQHLSAISQPKLLRESAIGVQMHLDPLHFMIALHSMMYLHVPTERGGASSLYCSHTATQQAAPCSKLGAPGVCCCTRALFGGWCHDNRRTAFITTQHMLLWWWCERCLSTLCAVLPQTPAFNRESGLGEAAP